VRKAALLGGKTLMVSKHPIPYLKVCELIDNCGDN
jgi:hypothetical protein